MSARAHRLENATVESNEMRRVADDLVEQRFRPAAPNVPWPAEELSRR